MIKGGFTAYLNAAYEWARGTNVSSAQFLFDPDEFAYIKKNWVFLDHDQRFTGSAGISYTWKDWRAGIDGLYGNGLRRGFANTQKNNPYETFNVSVSRRIQLTEKTALKIRFDVVNIVRQNLRTARRQRHRCRRAAIRPAPRILRNGRLRFLNYRARWPFFCDRAILDRDASHGSFAFS